MKTKHEVERGKSLILCDKLFSLSFSPKKLKKKTIYYFLHTSCNNKFDVKHSQQ